MGDFSDIIVYMAPWPVFDKISVVANYVAGLLTPTLLIFAILFRTFETQLGSFEGNAKWASAIKDFFLWGSVLTLYFLIGNLLTDFFNTIYAALAANESRGGLGGSLTAITTKLLEYIRQAEALVAKDEGIMDAIGNAFAGGALAMAYFVYYISIIGVAFVTIFMRLAFALGFGIVFIWGLIAIPLAITSNLKMLKGWGIFAGGILLWPIIESLIIALLIPVFDVAVTNLLAGFDSAEANKAGIYAIFTVLNFVLIAVMIAAPFVAGSLASNNSAMSGLVMPFVGAAFAATAASSKYVMRRTGQGVEKGAMATGAFAAGKTRDGTAWAGGKALEGAKHVGGKVAGVFNATKDSSASGHLSQSSEMFKRSDATSASRPVTNVSNKVSNKSSASSSGQSSSVKSKPEKSYKRKTQERGFFRNKNANLKHSGA